MCVGERKRERERERERDSKKRNSGPSVKIFVRERSSQDVLSTLREIF